MEKNNTCITVDTDDETVHPNENRNRFCRIIDLENEDEDEIVCIGVVDSPNDELDTGNTSQGSSSRKNNQYNVQVIDLECDNDQLDVIDVESEINDELEDTNYTLRVEDSSDEHNVIDVEDENLNNEEIRAADSVDCQDIEPENESEQSSSNVHTVEAIVHAEPDEAECSIDDYDARMREHFRLELDAFNDEPSTNHVERNETNDITHETVQSTNEEENLSIESDNIVANQIVRSDDLNQNQSTQSCDNQMECYSDDDVEDIIEINDDDGSGDDCVITSPLFYDVESSFKSDDSFTTLANINAQEKDNTPKRKKITETPGDIFRRMMPSAVPGVVSLFAPERNCLPDNIRPLKFCYYYFITSHLVVKEIQKNDFYKMKDQMLVAKKVIHPCTCLSHPLNKNASRITLLTNPQSLYHRSHCYFAQNSKKAKTDSPRKRGPRRLTYQVSFHRIPRKAEGKDFKDWNDVIIRRRQNATTKPSWSCSAAEKENKIRHQSSECKSEPDSWDDGVKMESVDEPIAIKTES